VAGDLHAMRWGSTAGYVEQTVSNRIEKRTLLVAHLGSLIASRASWG